MSVISSKHKWTWAALVGAALVIVGPGTDWVLSKGPGGGGHGGGGHGGGGHGGGSHGGGGHSAAHAPSGGGGRGFSAPSGGGGRGFSAPNGGRGFSAPGTGAHFTAPTHTGNTFSPGHTGNIGTNNFARTPNFSTMSTANLAAHARTIQAGQMHNGMPVHSVVHWNGAGNNATSNLAKTTNQAGNTTNINNANIHNANAHNANAHNTNINKTNTGNLAANARNIQAGQIRNGMPVHSVNHWNGNQHWNGNWNNNWHNNWHNNFHHHHNNFFFS